MKASSNSMIDSLSSFRFITALVVFLFHCQIHFGFSLGIEFFDKFVKHGAMFMTGFFVLSGFIMALVYDKTDFSKRENIIGYYKKRFAKIYPTYIVATLVYFVLFRDYSGVQYTRVLVNDTLLLQGFLPSMYFGLNGGTWSLCVEMLLYFLFPLLILISDRSSKILIVAALFVAIVSFNSGFDPLYSNPVFRIGDFLIGMGFYFLSKKGQKYCNVWSHIACVIAIIFVCRGMGSNGYMKGQFLLAPLFGFWITNVYFSRSKFYENKIFVYLGLISYSFYMWQFAAIEIGKSLLKIYPAWEVALIAFLINITLSVISYNLLEERAKKFILSKI